jgi:hypothetical protein
LNHKWFRNLAVSRIVAETLESLGMEFPAPSVDIEEIRKKYHAIAEEEGVEELANESKSKKDRRTKNKGRRKAEESLIPV